MLLNDNDIIGHVAAGKMLDPFISHQVRERDGIKCISFGLSSFGYDIRLGRAFKRRIGDYDPRGNPATYTEWEADKVVLTPGETILACSLETFAMPVNVLGICVGKSSLAREGILVNVTPLEPGWRGILTIEITNLSQGNVHLYPGDGIAQILFIKGEKPQTSYADRGGKYQNQTTTTESIL